MHVGGQILTPIAFALHYCKKMQSRQKISLAGLLEITLTQFVSCGAGDWALWPEYGRRKRIHVFGYVLGGVVDIPLVAPQG